MRLRGCDPEVFYPVASPVAHSFAGFWTFMLLTARLKVRLAIAGTFWRSAALYFLAYGSHLLIDLFTGTKLGSNTTASGIPLLWPWRKELGSPLILVVGVRHKDFPALFSMENLQRSSYELLIFGVITAALMVFIVGTTSERPCHASRVQNAGARCLQLKPDAIE